MYHAPTWGFSFEPSERSSSFGNALSSFETSDASDTPQVRHGLELQSFHVMEESAPAPARNNLRNIRKIGIPVVILVLVLIICVVFQNARVQHTNGSATSTTSTIPKTSTTLGTSATAAAPATSTSSTILTTSTCSTTSTTSTILTTSTTSTTSATSETSTTSTTPPTSTTLPTLRTSTISTTSTISPTSTTSTTSETSSRDPRGGGSSAVSPTGFSGAKLVLITWNQEMSKDTSRLSRKLSEAKDGSVAIVCQQETTKGFQGPIGWVRIGKDKLRGMTKPEQLKLAHQYISIYHRRVAGEQTNARVVKWGYEKLSMSGKGGIWAMVRICENGSCVDVVGACSHMPTKPKDRNEGLGKLLWGIAKTVGEPCDRSDMYPPKECWGNLHGVFVTGDLNYRLDGRLMHPALSDDEMLTWLKQSITDQKWSEMLKLDSLHKDTINTLQSPNVAFTCNTPKTYGPTYKVADSGRCRADNVVDCFLPPFTKLPMKGEEIGLGWLDRVCWYGQIGLHSEEWLYEWTGKSDHVPLYFVLDIFPRRM